MLRRVRIVSVPKARTGYQVKGSLANDVPAMGGADYNAYIGQEKPEVRKNLTAVPREQANLEAEGGETVIGNIDGSSMPSFYGIKGPRHHSGGVPLSLPDDSFIFSDTQAMKIGDPTILKMFNKPAKKGGYTPAELSKQYDINKYRQILQDPDTDKIARKTAELMIKNYVMKLGALALAQEAKKGFPQGIPVIAQPYMEANQIAPEQVMPELAQQATQEGMEQQGMMPEPQMEQGMQEGSPEEQMQMSPEEMQEAPMAAFGMQMGDYSMPFYSDPNEMAYGGSPKPISRPRPLPRADNGTQVGTGGGRKTKDNLTAEDKKLIEEKWNKKTDDYIAFVNAKRGITNNTKLVDAMYEQYKKDIARQDNYTKSRAALKTGYEPELAKLNKEQMVEQLLAQEERNARLAAHDFDPAVTDQNVDKANKGSKTNKQALALIKKTPGLSDLDFTKGYQGQAAYIAYRNTLNQPEYKQHGQFQVGVGDETIGGIQGKITGIDNYNTNTTLGQRLGYVEPEEQAGPCQCEKDKLPDGSPDPTFKPKDAQGRCTCTPAGETGCPCVDQNGKAILKADGTPEVAQKDKDGKCLPCTTKKTTCECPDGSDPGKDANGNCNECETTSTIPEKPEPEWWLQDTVNTMGAFGDTMNLKKYMPWESRVDLEEPRPTFLDPTRELAAQSEQANIASQAAAQFAGPQALNSRLAGIQGQGAKAAADTLSRVNNQNVGIANQFEANQVGVRNQESMANQQMANRVYDKNVIANQQFDNSKAQGRSNQRQAYNTAVTNKWKTDALNQMYPNYQTRPGVGGRVAYTPTEKTVDPGKEQDDMFKYRNELHAAGWTPEEIKAQMDRKYGKAKKHGGEQHNGYIYTDWPIFL
jgi:hypothetical protein